MTFLEKIVVATLQRLCERKEQKPLAVLERQVKESKPTRSFASALRAREITVIAEVKRASPSKGWLCPDLRVAPLVQSYAQGGAAAISVLTEPQFFRGSPEDLLLAHRAVDLPLLCKDFVLDSYQIYEARVYGADAVLLIAAILSPSQLSDLIKVAESLGMSALVEVHQREEVEKALDAQAQLIGINNRNLADFTVDLRTTLSLRSLIPPSHTVVSESGIKTPADVSLLQSAGVNAILVGESLVTAQNPASKISELLGKTPRGETRNGKGKDLWHN